MSGVNKVIVVGNLGADPELKTVTSGQSVARLSVATTESWMGKDGQRQEKTEWHRIVVWGRQAENCAKHLSKGRQVYVEGRLQTRKYEDATSGQTKYTTEIIANNVQFLGGGRQASDSTMSSQDSQDFGPEPKFEAAEDVPF